ncbi:MAG: flagellar hook basal-body protein [Planctomycetota bacterium]
MIYGLYNSAAGMMTNEYRQNVIANNLANADTVGFKQQVAVFAERQPESVSGPRQGPSAPDLAALSGGLWLGRTYTDHGAGSLVYTDRSQDLALEGPGFLVVEDQGQQLYTRDGRLIKDADGYLRSAADGVAILGTGGVPIRMNPHGSQPTFDEDGRVLQDNLVVGRLAIVDFDNYEQLQPAGHGRFTAGEAETISSPARVRPGYVENSGVAPIKELVSMMETSRAYQINAQMLTLQDQSIGQLIRTIAR